MGTVADRTTVRASDEEILAAFLANKRAGIKGAAVATRTPWPLASKALKRMGVVSNPRAGSGRELESGDMSRTLDLVSDAEWHFLAGVFYSQKTGVTVSGNTVRLHLTISDQGRLGEVASIMGVGEVNLAPTNGGKNTQSVYRIAQKDMVRRFLTEVQGRMPGRHPGVEKGLAALHAAERYSKENEYEEGTEGSYGPD